MTTQNLQALAEEAMSGKLPKSDIALLESLLPAAAEPEPDDKVVQSGDSPMVRTVTSSAGYVTLRRNSDGKLVSINKNQLAERWKQKLDDGRQAWLAPDTPWHGKPKEGMLRCLLHAEHPDRHTLDHLMLDDCTKRGKMPHKAALRRHMKAKHREAWETIQQDRVERREDEATSDRKGFNSAMLTIAGGEAAARSKARSQKPVIVESCEVCGQEFESTVKVAVLAKLKAHMKAEHPSGQEEGGGNGD